MEHYTFTEAARELGVSRQTIYKYVKRDESVYTTVTGKKRVITLYGMELLQKAIQGNAEKYGTIDKTIDAPGTVDTWKTDRIKELESTVDSLQNEVNGLQEQLKQSEQARLKAEGYREGTEAAMKDLHETIKALSSRRSWWPWGRKRLLSGETSSN